jgi:hypothetical protein
LKDTVGHVDAFYLERFAALSPDERLAMVADMFDTARTLMEADIRSSQPDISPRDLRVEQFKRLYWNDFDQDTMAKIIAKLR